MGSVSTIREERAVVDGISMRWLEAGHGWPVVLLHAFPLSADMWRPQLEDVPNGFRYIAPDLYPRTGDGIDGYARNVGALLDSLEIGTCPVGGLSMGGYVTFALHRLEPRRFSRMILADTRPQADSEQARAGRQDLRQRLVDGGVRAVADVMVPRLLSEQTRRDRPAVVQMIRQMIEGQPPALIDAAIAAMLDRPDSTSQLARIGVPVLIVAGEADEVTPPDVAREMEQLVPRAHRAIIAGAGHLSSIEQPAAFSRVLHDFLLAPL